MKMIFKKQYGRFLTGLLVLTFVGLVSSFLVSCYIPSPLYGVWMNDQKDSLTINSGSPMEFTASFYDEKGSAVLYSGTCITKDNVIIFTIDGGGMKMTEWDIRGNILYLTWTDEFNRSRTLKLYHVG